MSEQKTGIVSAFYEQGMENVCAVFEDTAVGGFAGMNILEDGDLLTIFNDAARTEIVWQGVIEMDYKAGLQENGVYRAATGRSVLTQHAGPFLTLNGIPKGWAPDQWAEVLVAELPATLVKALVKVPGP